MLKVCFYHEISYKRPQNTNYQHHVCVFYSQKISSLSRFKKFFFFNLFAIQLFIEQNCGHTDKDF